DAVREHVEPAGGRDARVLLAQGAGGGVPRVGERVLPGGDQGRVELLERGDREEDLPADLDRRGVVGAGEDRGHGVDGAHVERDVLPDPSVAAGDAADQAPGVVGEADGQPVDLELGGEGDVGAAGL